MSNSQKVAIGTEEVNALVGKAEGVQGEMKGLLGRTAGTVDAVQNPAVWHGSGKSAFGNVTAEYQQASQKLQNSMAELLETMRANLKTYRGSEDEVASSISSAGSGVSGLNLNIS